MKVKLTQPDAKTLQRILVAAGAAGMVGLASPAAADTVDRGALEALFEEPVTTSATGAPQRATDAPVNMTIISQEDIQRSGAVDLPGVLERLANVDVMRTSRGQVDVSVRGYNTPLSPRLLVLLNGRQVYLDSYGMTNWSTIPVQMSEIRQIEVVTGPNTALFGFNAVAGTVNIITYDALHDDIDAVSLTAGDPDYLGGSMVWTARPSDRLGLRFSYGAFNAVAGPDEDGPAQEFLFANAVDPTGRTAAINAAFALNADIRLDAEVTWSRSERTDRYGFAMFEFPYETNSFKLGVTADTPLGLVTGQIYSNYLHHGVENRTTVADVALVAKPAPAHTLRFAGEIRRNGLEQNSSELFYDLYAASVMWNWQATENFALTSAIRYDSLALERSGGFISPAFPFTNPDYDQSFSELSFNVGGVYRLSDNDSLRFSVARGVGSPSLLHYGYELDVPLAPGTSFFIAGNPDISPTIVYNAEAGWDHDLRAIDGRLRLAAFWQRNEDLLAFASRTEIYSFAPFVSALITDQIGDSEMYGLEFGISGRTGAFQWDGQYSWRHIDDTLDVSSDGQFDYEHTSPEHVLTTGIAWTRGRLELGADLRYTSATSQFDVSLSPFERIDVDAYVQTNARAAWRLNDAVQLELSGRNLLEDDQQTVGLALGQRAFYLSLKAAF